MSKLDHTNLYDFQKVIYNLYKDKENAALLLDMGCG
jgi:hypothetical protein